MNIDWELVGLIVIPIVCVVLSATLARWFERRPRLRVFLEHATGIRMQAEGQQPMIVNTHSVVLRNVGGKTETNVRLGHRPVQFWYQVQPEGLHTERRLPDGGREIVFERLVPGKSIYITYLYFAPVLWTNVNTHIDGDTGAAKSVQMVPSPVLPKWLQALLWLLVITGLVTWLYLAVVAARSYTANDAAIATQPMK